MKSFTQMMEDVSRVYSLGPVPHTMWQLCSAATHGKRWAVPMLAMMDAIDDGGSGTITGKIVSDEASIRNALLAACQVLERALTVRDAHSRPAGHTGQSFFRVTAR